MQAPIGVFRWITPLLSILLSVFWIACMPTSALADQCFSKLGDSAWNMGQPQEISDLIKNTKNYALVGFHMTFTNAQGKTKSLGGDAPNGGMTPFDINDTITNGNSWYYRLTANTPIKTTWVYKGADCSQRTVNAVTTPRINYPAVVKPSDSNYPQAIQDTFEPVSLAQLKSTQIFLNKDFEQKALGDFLNWISSSQSDPISVTDKMYSTDVGDGIVFIKFLQIFHSYNIDAGWGLFKNLPEVVSPDGCIATKPGSQGGDGIIYGPGPYVFPTKNNVCALDIYMVNTFSPDSKGSGPRVPSSYVYLGQLHVKDATPHSKISTKENLASKSSLKSIQCIRGKKILKVTSLSPTCPLNWTPKKK